MPITRKKRANPSDQPEENITSGAETAENSGDVPTQKDTEQATQMATTADVVESIPQSVAETSIAQGESVTQPSSSTSPTNANGERISHLEHPTSIESGRRTPRGELFRRAPQLPPPVLAPAQSASVPPIQPVQPPAREISLPMGNLLHLAYNPGYTGAEDSRSQLLQHLAQESKDGGRARCWNCGVLAIVYDRWNTRSKTFGEVGVAICEACGVWSVM